MNKYFGYYYYYYLVAFAACVCAANGYSVPLPRPLPAYGNSISPVHAGNAHHIQPALTLTLLPVPAPAPQPSYGGPITIPIYSQVPAYSDATGAIDAEVLRLAKHALNLPSPAGLIVDNSPVPAARSIVPSLPLTYGLAPVPGSLSAASAGQIGSAAAATSYLGGAPAPGVYGVPAPVVYGAPVPAPVY